MAPSKLISTSQGFQDSKGTVVANGMLMLQLSQACTVTSGGGQVTTEPIYLNLDSSGKITSTAIWFNDELSPSGTIYYGTVYASNKTRMIPGLEKLQYSITGASFDLATAVQSGSASPSFSGAVLLTPSGNQTITTGNLTLTTGQFIETANAVTGSGGLVRATSPTLTTPNIGVATATTVNKVTITQPASSATLTIINGKTFTVNNTLGIFGTDSTTHTFPNVTGDTVAELAATQTLTNKTLGGAGSTTPNTPFNRFKATQGSALVTGDVGSLTGWGTTATVSAVTGRDSCGSITISSSGTGQAANASFVLTFHDGTWSTAPIPVALRGDSNAPTGGGVAAAASATVCTFVFLNGTPVAGTSYTFNFVFIGQ